MILLNVRGIDNKLKFYNLPLKSFLKNEYSTFLKNEI